MGASSSTSARGQIGGGELPAGQWRDDHPDDLRLRRGVRRRARASTPRCVAFGDPDTAMADLAVAGNERIADDGHSRTLDRERSVRSCRIPGVPEDISAGPSRSVPVDQPLRDDVAFIDGGPGGAAQGSPYGHPRGGSTSISIERPRTLRGKRG